MKIYVDDGSTACKSAWREGKEIKTHISGNSFVNRWQISAGAKEKRLDYMLNGERYSYSTGDGVIATRKRASQLSDVAAISVQHNLQTSGLKPQAVDVVVTLPVEMFFTDLQPDTANIEAKRKAIMQPVELNNGEAFTIRSVEVFPEALPGAMTVLDRMPDHGKLLVIDTGGTTTDVCLISGDGTSIDAITGADVGVSLVTDKILSFLDRIGFTTSQAVADSILSAPDRKAYFDDLGFGAYYPEFENVLQEGQRALSRRVASSIDNIRGYTHAVCIGGGSSLVVDHLRDTLRIPRDNFYHVDEPQLALVSGLALMGE